jgi:Ca2+/H+ antiporter, TMEM165/GDT1 family
MFEVLGVSASVVALGEVGDKTQLLAFLLAARYRRPWPIVAGILVATLANHALASALGAWLAQWLDPQWLRWGLGLSFIAVALWLLRPDDVDDVRADAGSRWGVFGITVVAFFLAEMGDKTQVATVMLAARYQSLWLVTAGTTLGMLIANVPAVLLGERIKRWLPVVWVHRVAAAVFALMGLALMGSALSGASGGL